MEPEGGDLCSVNYGNVRWKQAQIFPWLKRMLLANNKVGWKLDENVLRTCRREKIWSFCLWKNPALVKENGTLLSSRLAIKYGYTRIGDLVVNKFAADACRWIDRADIARWVPDRHLPTVLRSLMEAKVIVQQRFGDRATARAGLRNNDIVILSQADEYQGPFEKEVMWRVTGNNGADAKLVCETEHLDTTCLDDGAKERIVRMFQCIPVETYRGVPIGVVERTSINLDDFISTKDGGKIVRMSEASVKDIYKSSPSCTTELGNGYQSMSWRRTGVAVRGISSCFQN